MNFERLMNEEAAAPPAPPPPEKTGVTITAVIELDTTWASREDLLRMTDQDVLELVQEDLHSALEHATWTINRGQGIPPATGLQHIRGMRPMPAEDVEALKKASPAYLTNQLEVRKLNQRALGRYYWPAAFRLFNCGTIAFDPEEIFDSLLVVLLHANQIDRELGEIMKRQRTTHDWLKRAAYMLTAFVQAGDLVKNPVGGWTLSEGTRKTFQTLPPGDPITPATLDTLLAYAQQVQRNYDERARGPQR